MDKDVEQKLAERAWDCQNACNPTAVANFLVSACKAIADTEGTDAACNHPIVKVIVGKLCSMAGLYHDSKIYDEFLTKYPQFIGK